MESKDSLRHLDLAAAAMPAFVLLAADGRWVAAACVIAGALVTLGLFFRWYRARWGTWPQTSEAPAEIRRAYGFCLAAVIVALVPIAAVGFFGTPIVTIAVTFGVYATLFWACERKVYPAACAKVRARLA